MGSATPTAPRHHVTALRRQGFSSGCLALAVLAGALSGPVAHAGGGPWTLGAGEHNLYLGGDSLSPLGQNLPEIHIIFCQ